MKNRLKLFLSILLISFSIFSSNAQVAINTTGNSPDPSAMLDVVSDSKGLLIPRLLTSQRTTLATTAVDGLLVFDSEEQSFYLFSNSAWIDLSSSANIWTQNATDVSLTNIANNVGIGTSTPFAKLEVKSSNTFGIISDCINTGGLSACGIFGNAVADVGAPSSIGVYGISKNGNASIGVYGDASGTTYNYGIYGSASGGLRSWAGFFMGDLHTSENLTVNTVMQGARLSVRNSDTEDILNLYDGSTEVMTVTDGGKLGLGTGMPADNTKLHVLQTGTAVASQFLGTVACFQTNFGTNYWSRVSIIGGNEGASVLDLGDADNQQAGRISYEHTDNFMTFQTDDTEKMRISSSGNVGIGSSSPLSKFHVSGGNIRLDNSDFLTELNISNSSTDQWSRAMVHLHHDALSADNQDIQIMLENATDGGGGDGTLIIRNWQDASQTYNDILKYGMTDQNLSFSSSNCDLQGGLFSLASENFSALSLTANGTNGREYRITSTDDLNGLGGGKMAFYDETAGAPRMVINSSGNIGIGNISPSWKLDVGGDVNFTGDLYQNGSLFNLSEAGGWTDDGTVVRLTNLTDLVGIGTSTPTANLDIAGSGTPVLNLSTTNDQGADAIFRIKGARTTNANADISQIEFYNAESGGEFQMAEISSRNADNLTETSFSDLVFKVNNGTDLIEAVRIDDTGNVGIGTTAPDASAILDLTSTEKGILPPRMTEAQRDAISSPATGLLIYQTDGEEGYYSFDGSNWVLIGSEGTGNNDPGAAGIGTIYGTVVNNVTGKVWLDRNLGASQVATSSTDALAYGDLYQWGRTADGHQLRTSTTYAGPVTFWFALDGNAYYEQFITTTVSPNDWLDTQKDDLWTGTYAENNPCPCGFRLPTNAEWVQEIRTWSSQDAAGAFASPLKLTSGGFRVQNGTFSMVGSNGYYWSSSVYSSFALHMFFSSFSAGVNYLYRGRGYAVRCIKD